MRTYGEKGQHTSRIGDLVEQIEIEKEESLAVLENMRQMVMDDYNAKLKKIQDACPHTYDDGEYARKSEHDGRGTWCDVCGKGGI